MSKNPVFVAKVVHGHKRGRELGFPTANLELNPKNKSELPKNGIYAGFIEVQKSVYKTAVHLGPIKTFGQNKIHLEAYILDFNKEIYGQIVKLELLARLRDLITFDNLTDLIEQIKLDVQKTRLVLPKIPVNLS